MLASDSTPTLTLPVQGLRLAIEAELLQRKRNRFLYRFPEEGPMRRELYPKHIRAIEATANHGEVALIGGNRIGKTSLGAFIVTAHTTGRYPAWWKGRRFNRPVQVWVAGKTGETTRDIPQAELFGEPGNDAALGTGMIPFDCIHSTTPKAGIPNGYDTAWIKHVSGGLSTIGFKSYGKNRDSFEGTKKDIVWTDEEPPMDVYGECIMRLAATSPGETSGLMLVTFTPLEGHTAVVESFFSSNDPDKWFIQIGWNDVPHIPETEKEKLRRKFLPSQIRARENGEPELGEGAIYPIEDIESLKVDPFPIPALWKRAFGMDFGKTAVVWGAIDPDSDILYLYDEYYSEIYNPELHSLAIKGRGDWIPGAADPAGLQSNQVDGRKLMDIYRGLGLKLAEADNAVETGINAVWVRLSTGRLRVFRTLNRWFMELGRYHRKKQETIFGVQNKIVKKEDHEMDATRYLVMTGLGLAKLPVIHKPVIVPTAKRRDFANTWG